MKHGKSSAGDRTLLDALQHGLNSISVENSSREFVQLFAEGCMSGAERTKIMRPMVGRSSYSISDRDAEYEFSSSTLDPGAYAVAIIAQSIEKALNK